MTQAYFDGAIIVSLIGLIMMLFGMAASYIVKHMKILSEKTRENWDTGFEMVAFIGMFVFIAVFWTTFL